MEKLVILNHSDTSVHFYDIHSDVTVNEEYIENLGYHCSNCSWMSGKEISITFHKEVLK